MAGTVGGPGRSSDAVRPIRRRRIALGRAGLLGSALVLVRRLTPVLAAAALAGLAATSCAAQPVGVRVGDNTFSESDLVEELDAFGSNEALFAASGQSAAGVEGEALDSYNQQFVGQIVQQRITFMLAEVLFERNDLELSEDDRDSAQAELASNLGAAVDEFPDGYRERFIDDVARYNMVADELGPQEFELALVETASSVDIEVGSRFGEWDEDQFSVQPPVGSTPAPAGRSSDGGGGGGPGGDPGTGGPTDLPAA
jgi:hypothetical protein